MKIDTLDNLLAGQDPAAECSYLPGEIVTYGQVLRRAQMLRERFPEVLGKRVALCGLTAAEFIEAIIAFDGFVEAMFLIPASLGPEIREELIRSASCKCCIESGWNLVESAVGVSRSMADWLPTSTRWLLATSGTTDKPKLVEHTLASLSRTVKREHNTGIWYHWGLLYDPNRFAGLQVILQALLSGDRLTIPATNEFEDQIRSLIIYPVNALSATPSLWRKLLMDGRVKSLPLRQITLGGEVADQMILNALRREFANARITHIYASTEAGTGFSVNDGRAGFPVAWLDNPNAPVQLRVNADNHLLIKPPVVPDGDVVRSRLDTYGFLDTEDLARIDGDRVHFLGRASGAINVGGNKVNPEEIETILRQAPSVYDARVYAKPSSLLGQLVAADIVATSSENRSELRQDIKLYCRQFLETWQIPATINFVDDLFLTAAGKVDRRIP